MNNIMLQNYMATYKPQQKRQDASFESEAKIATPTVIRGHLVNEDPIIATISTVQDYATYATYLKNAAQGKGNDYSLGKINDLTLRAGSLGIAAVLASKIQSPIAKTMEFVGFGTFFAAMSIWPKLAIAAPVKMMYGFDPTQKYVDSQGQKKSFFMDRQYLAWDLWDNKKINKIGDKLGIPRDIENREKHIKAKMGQISTQSNTLWMLTAGFATPLLGSLMANYTSKGISKIAETYRGYKADSLLSKNEQNIEKRIVILDKAIKLILGGSSDESYKSSFDGILKLKPVESRDGATLIGNAWAKLPGKVLKYFGLNESQQLAFNYRTEAEAKVMTEQILNNFIGKDGKVNAEAVEKALSEYAKAISPFVSTLNTQSSKLESYARETQKLITAQKLDTSVEASVDSLVHLEQNLAHAQSYMIIDSVSNTKQAFYQPMIILEKLLGPNLDRETLYKEIYGHLSGTTAHDIFNNFENLVAKATDSDSYIAGVEKYYQGFSQDVKDNTKRIIGNDALFEDIMKHYDNTRKFLLPLGSKESQKIPLAARISEVLGKTTQDLLADAAKENLLYKGWLKKTGVAFAVLSGITLVSTMMFGKTNEYNKDIYRFKNK